MGQHQVTHDPCDSSDFRDPFDPWPMTHRPIPCSDLQQVQNAATRLVTGTWNMSVVCLGWCTMTCTGWLFLSEYSTSLLWQSIVVFGTELQGILIAGYCVPCSLWSFWSPYSTCDLPDVINCHFTFGTRTLFVAALPDYQLLTPNNLGDTWRRVSSLDSRRVSALKVLRNRAIQTEIYLLTCILATQSYLLEYLLHNMHSTQNN